MKKSIFSCHRYQRVMMSGLIAALCCGVMPDVSAAVAPGNRELSRQLAAECMVLLKNDREALPLQPGDRVAVFGAGQIDFIKGGWGSGDVNVEHVVNLLDALQVKEKQSLLQLAPSVVAAYRANAKLDLTGELVQQGRREADKALVVISRNSGEGRDRSPKAGDYYLTEKEENMLRLVCAGGFDRVIVVLNVGGVIDCAWLKRYPVDALLNVWQPGMEGGHAAADVLTGTASPSGRLTSTWAAKWDEYPSSGGFFQSRDYVNYEEDIFVGYRYFETFDPAGEKICFPFGFGLSYTTFAITPVTAQNRDGKIAVAVAVTNTGKRPGREVVQVYCRAPQGKLGRPAKELVGFAKTGVLAPGVTEQVTIKLEMNDMAAYDDTGCTGQKGCWVLEAGDYQILAGTSVRDLLPQPVITVRQPELKVVEKAVTRLTPNKLPRRLMADGKYKELPVTPDAAPEPRIAFFPVKPAGATMIEAELFQQRNGGKVDTFTDDFGIGKCISSMDRAGCFAAYQLEVEKAGKYALRFRLANGRPENPDQMDLFINGKLFAGKVKVPQTGDGHHGEWYNFIDLDPIVVELPAGRVELKIQSKGYFVNIDCFHIAPAESMTAAFADVDKAKEVRRQERQAMYAKHQKRPDVKKVMFREVAANPALLDDFMAQLSDMDLVNLASGYAPLVPGGTGRIGVLEDLGCPGVETCDGPAGVRLKTFATAWPCSTALASGWDVEMAARLGQAVAAEALLNGADIWLAPGMNIHRNPMCGRNFEYYSEDPFLSGKMAAALTGGVQKCGVGVTVKHFAFNNKEGNRNSSDSRISERAIREIYLKGFEIVIKEADPWCLMSSYNFINGCETSESHDLLNGILRQEWQYRGLIMTDWTNNSQHEKELPAGNNVKMPRGLQEQLLYALEDGRITREQLIGNARYVLELVLRSGVLQRKGSVSK